MTPTQMAARIAELEAQLASAPRQVSRGPVMLSRDLECFASMDWGRLKPGCFAWWMAIPAEPETRYHIVAEWKFQGLDDEDIADGYHEMCKFLSLKPKYIAGDPSMWIADGRNRARGQSRGETFQKCRMPMKKALNDRVSGWARLARMLRVPVDATGAPTGALPILTIDQSCAYLIRSLPALRSDRTNAEDVDTNGDDHGGDCVRYGAASRPMPANKWIAPPPPKGTMGDLLHQLRGAGARQAVLGADNVRSAA